jgi:hypothetical protein
LEKDKQPYIGHKNVREGPHKRILLVVPFPNAFAELKMIGKNTLDAFKAQPQVVRQ